MDHPAALPDAVTAGTPGIVGSSWTRRRPILLLRFDGAFLLRFAERRFPGLLFQEPPRRTTNASTGSLHRGIALKPHIAEDALY